MENSPQVLFDKVMPLVIQNGDDRACYTVTPPTMQTDTEYGTLIYLENKLLQFEVYSL